MSYIVDAASEITPAFILFLAIHGRAVEGMGDHDRLPEVGLDAVHAAVGFPGMTSVGHGRDFVIHPIG
jgi:hypothetical protein